MSARRLLALLVVVALGLLLICPTALSRSTLSLTDATGSNFTTNPDDDDEDPDIPNGNLDGDDDNWDKPGTKGHTVAEQFDGNSGAGTGAGANGSEVVLSRMEISLSVRLALLLQSWVINSYLR
jgi:hypothetical protein